MSGYVFGYGSLLFRPDFAHDGAPRVATLDGCERRFAQGSPDHRGTPESPGRVVTLVPAPGSRCGGLVYTVRDDDLPAVLAYLDHREQGGYERAEVAVTLAASGARVTAFTWIAREGNPHWLGDADEATVLAHIARSAGPSGRNGDYLRRLDETLRALGLDDPYVARLAEALRARG